MRHLKVPTCSHCGLPRRGSAGVLLKSGYYPLCHPDEGLDCYHLVTVYKHPITNCTKCQPIERSASE
jgi:hypothetical protein